MYSELLQSNSCCCFLLDGTAYSHIYRYILYIKYIKWPLEAAVSLPEVFKNETKLAVLGHGR